MTNALNALTNSVPARFDGELEIKKATTPEQRYIEYLEEKISRLLKEARVGSLSEVIVSRTDHLPSIIFVALGYWQALPQVPAWWRR